jgi:ferritin-like metal-binding protein YciE
MARKTIEDLFIHDLSDIYSAEKQLTRALAKLSRVATDEPLSKAFETHMHETEGQIERIDKVVEICGFRLRRVKCVAMEGLIEEAQELVDEIEKGAVLDAGLIGAAQKVEHYEMSSYITARNLAQQLHMTPIVQLLQTSLGEEENADQLLNQIARPLMTAAKMPESVE